MSTYSSIHILGAEPVVALERTNTHPSLRLADYDDHRKAAHVVVTLTGSREERVAFAHRLIDAASAIIGWVEEEEPEEPLEPEYDPGPEVDDEGGMSEYRQPPVDDLA